MNLQTVNRAMNVSMRPLPGRVTLPAIGNHYTLQRGAIRGKNRPT